MELVWLLLKIYEVPDVSLNKYNTSNKDGISNLLEFHHSFLRQWHRKGILSGISIHLFYHYEPTRENGERMGTFLGFLGPQKGFANILQLLKASSLLSQYQFEIVWTPNFPFQKEEVKATGFKMEDKKGRDGLWERLNLYSYDKCCMLTKKEIFSPSLTSNEPYYTIAEWETNDEGRLREFYSLIRSLNIGCCIRFDIYPVDWEEQIRDSFNMPMAALKSRQLDRRDLGQGRDYGVDAILHSYDRIRQELEGMPKFRVNIFGFGSRVTKNGDLNCDNIEMLLDSVGSEAIQSGDYDITEIRWEFMGYGVFSFLDEGEKQQEALCGDKLFRRTKHGYELMNIKSSKNKLRFLPTVFSLKEVSPIFRLPVLDEKDEAEIRKETSPKVHSEKDGLFLGTDDKGYRITFDLNLLKKHALIAGVPGSGKTNMMLHMLSSLWIKFRIPFLVFEPAKQEYRALANQRGMEDIYIFSPNVDMRFPLHINPFEFPVGLTVSEHIRQLNAVFEGAFPLVNPLPFILDRAIEAAYLEMGWLPDDVYVEGMGRSFPTMSILYEKLEEELAKSKYAGDVADNMQAMLQMRIGGLLRRELGEIFDVPRSTFAPEEWLTKPAVIELEALGAGPANFTTLLICTLIRESLKIAPRYDEKPVRHVLLIEEAHNLIGMRAEETTGDEANPKKAATSFIVKMLAEVRALKESIIIADQLPTVMAAEVLKNTSLKIGLRITSVEDQKALCDTMAASAIQSEEMGVLPVGRALISYEEVLKPFVIQTPLWLEYETWIRNSQEREYIAAPRSDAELERQLSGRKSYIEIRERSFNILLTKWCQQCIDNGKKLSRVIKLLESDEQHDLIKNCEDLCRETEILLKKSERFKKKWRKEELQYFNKVYHYQENIEKNSQMLGGIKLYLEKWLSNPADD